MHGQAAEDELPLRGEHSAEGTLGAQLRRLRLRAGLSQEVLAVRAGVGVATLAALERDARQRPHPRTLANLIQALGVTQTERNALVRARAPEPALTSPSSAASQIDVRHRSGHRNPLYVRERPHAASTTRRPMVQDLARGLSSLVGRQQELEYVLGLLQTARLVTLTGAGGVGKTRLAFAVAGACSTNYPHGVRLAFLGSITHPGLVPQAVAGAIGVPEQGRRSLITTLTEALRDQHLLLVLDNCEHLIQACAELVETLMQNCSTLTVLATSREALGLTCEMTWRVPSLGLPNPPAPPAEQLSQFEAVRLFVDRAVAIRSNFQLTNVNAAAVAEVCWRLDGIPLAIELAAAWMEVLSVEELAARLDDRFDLLVGGSRTAPPRQQTLRGAIEWSYDLLTPEERQVFAAFAVFAGGWTVHAAERVCVGQDIPPEAVLGLLRRLVDKSLVVVDQTPNGTRFRLLETLRSYATERAQAAGEFSNLQRRHVEWCLDLAEAASPQQLDPKHIAILANEQDNLRAAMRRCIEAGDSQTGLRLGVALWSFWYVRGLYTEGYSWLEQLLAIPPQTQSSATRARAQAFAGHLAFCRGDYRTAEDLLDEALATARQAEDEQSVAVALQLLGTPARGRGDLTRAESLYEQARAINRRLGSRVWEAMTLGNLAMTAEDNGDHAKAQAFAAEALAVYGEQRHAWGVARMREILARVAVSRGDYHVARNQLEEAVSFQRELGDRQGLVLSLPTLARLALGEGDAGRAGQLLGEGLILAQQADDKLALIRGLEAVAALLGGRHAERALWLAGAAAGLREALGAQPTPVDRDRLAQWQALAKRQLGMPAYFMALADGRRRALKDAVDDAIEAANAIASLAAAKPPTASSLTRREQEVAACLARGLSNRQVAQALTISEGTARIHVQHVLDKLGLNSRVQVAEYVRRVHQAGHRS